MSDDERIKRPAAQRTGPIRDPAAGATGAREAPPDRDARESDDALRGVIARSVELGYRVVDEYVQQGQRAARLLSERQVDAESVAREAPEMFSRMLRSASDIASLWLDLAGAAQASGARAWPRPGERAREPAPPAPAPRERAPAATPALSISLDVRASQRAEARLDLRSGAATDAIAVHELRSPDPDKPRLRVRLERSADDGAPVIVIDVPEGQPAGLYAGVVLDESRGVPIGSLRVTLDPPR